MDDIEREFEIDWANQLCEGTTLLKLELAGIDAAKVKDFARKIWGAGRIRGAYAGVRLFETRQELVG